MSNPIVRFAETGALGLIKIGMDYEAVLEIAGESDGDTGAVGGGGLVIHSFEDVQLGFTGGGVLCYLAIEPRGLQTFLPAFAGKSGIVKTPRQDELINYLSSLGEEIERCEPFVSGEFWWKVKRTGVLMSFNDADGMLEAINISL
ncbi:hypothetical protein ACFY05_06655 [Microtetraspora fusca]|uniref:Uncharacterized protein n=1 Tax=Microtetraspora fusca TaxID=1997 RepID=A0ABW6V3A0_MICFU